MSKCEHSFVYKILHTHEAVDVCEICGIIRKQMNPETIIKELSDHLETEQGRSELPSYDMDKGTGTLECPNLNIEFEFSAGFTEVESTINVQDPYGNIMNIGISDRTGTDIDITGIVLDDCTELKPDQGTYGTMEHLIAEAIQKQA